MVPMWNGSLSREIESQRPPEILEAETSTRSRGTSRKGPRFERARRVSRLLGPTRTSGCFPHRSRGRASAASAGPRATARRSRRPTSSGPPGSSAPRRPSASADSATRATRGPSPNGRRRRGNQPVVPTGLTHLETRLARSKRGLFGSFLETGAHRCTRTLEKSGRSLGTF